MIKRVQLNSRSAPYWNQDLEASREAVQIKMKVARESGSIEDERAAKHMRNIHSRNIKNRIKQYLGT